MQVFMLQRDTDAIGYCSQIFIDLGIGIGLRLGLGLCYCERTVRYK